MLTCFAIRLRHAQPASLDACLVDGADLLSRRRESDVSSATFEFEANPSPIAANERAALLENPGFGKLFTDHMVMIR